MRREAYRSLAAVLPNKAGQKSRPWRQSFRRSADEILRFTQFDQAAKCAIQVGRRRRGRALPLAFRTASE